MTVDIYEEKKSYFSPSSPFNFHGIIDLNAARKSYKEYYIPYNIEFIKYQGNNYYFIILPISGFNKKDITISSWTTQFGFDPTLYRELDIKGKHPFDYNYEKIFKFDRTNYSAEELGKKSYRDDYHLNNVKKGKDFWVEFLFIDKDIKVINCVIDHGFLVIKLTNNTNEEEIYLTHDILEES